uniref:Uncharacterized protein n=1 Tax=Anguilla anguilla TaxID=7936 RepID=A0A0E9SG98_ANGAN
MRLRSGLCAGQSSSSTPLLQNHFNVDLRLCALGGIALLKQERAFPRLLGKHRII